MLKSAAVYITVKDSVCTGSGEARILMKDPDAGGRKRIEKLNIR